MQQIVLKCKKFRMKSQVQTNTFLKKIVQTCNELQLIQTGQSVLCAVSGGPDSICLFRVCQYLENIYDIQLSVAHIHHGLRGERADHDADFVKNMARAANLPFHFEQVDVFAYQQKYRCSLEEAARDLRYRALTNICKTSGYQLIALGHHADDNAEQLLMNLIRGTGPKGLTGIIPKRSLDKAQNIQLIRPLIYVYRNEIESFLKDMNQKWMIDETNENFTFLRNRVRHHLIPILKSYNPNIKMSLNQLADIQRIDTQWQDTVADTIFLESIIHRDKNQIVLNSHNIKQHHLSVIRSVLRKAVYQFKGNLRRISYTHIQNLSHWLLMSGKTKKMSLPDNLNVKITNNKVTLRRNQIKKSADTFCYQIDGPGKIYVPECNMILQLDLLAENFVLKENYEFSDNHVFFDADVVLFPLIVRNIEAGDRFQPFGMIGHQKVSRFFINQKVSRSKRSQAALLISQNKIVWVIGYRISQAASIVRSTQRVLECRCTFN